MISYRVLCCALALTGCLYGTAGEAFAAQASSAQTNTSGKWMIRLLTYADKGRAAGLIQRLKKKGFVAEMGDVSTNSHGRYQVRIKGLADLEIIIMPVNGGRYQVRIKGLADRQQALHTRSRLLKDTSITAVHIQIIPPSHGRPIRASTTPPEETPSGNTGGFHIFSEPVLPDWHFYGSNTTRYDDFNSSGDNTSSPYRFTGSQTYDELNLNIERHFTPYNRVTGQVTGLLFNESKYRSSFFGAVPERLNIKQENGDFLIPYRVEGGDFFAFQSFRTIQRSLKGVQLELQPDLGGGARHSISLFSGGGSPAWRSFQLEDDWSNGVSWLADHPVYGRMSANLVFNHKKANQAAGLQSNQQYVYSLAYEKKGVLSTLRWPWLAQRLTVEGELSRFIGDHADVNGAGSGQNRQGNGYFVQVSGSPVALPALGYRVRYEAYEQDYRPNGGNIQPDRRSEEGHLSWRFAGGLTARTRIQNFHTAWQTNNPTDTNIYGVNLSGPLGFGRIDGLSGGIDAFEQDAESRDLTTNTVTKSLNANLSKSINRNVSARGGFFYSNTRDRTNASTGVTITRQYSAGLDFRLSAFGVTGTISPGIVARSSDTQGGMTNRDYNPTLNINARRGPHRLSLSYSAQDQGRPQNDLGVVTRTIGGNYAYRQKDYTLGVEGNWYERNPDKVTTRRTDAWRVGAFLTLNFDKPVRTRPAPSKHAAQPTMETSAPAPAASSSTARFALDIASIKPGMRKDAVRNMIASTGLGAPTEQAGLLLWFARVMRDIDENQRLAVDVSDGAVARTALVIEFNDVGNSADAQHTFERVRQEMLEQYGQPDGFFDQGDFTPNLGVDVAANRFIRVMQWQREGGVLRFGIPRRNDGRLRMELQFARNFPSLQDSRWSMEELQ